MRAWLAQWRQLLRTTAIRLALRYAALQTLLLAMALALTLGLAHRYVDSQIESGLASETAALAALPLPALAQRIAANAEAGGPRHYLLIDAQGRRLAGSLLAWPKGLRVDGRMQRVQGKVREAGERGETEKLPLMARAVRHASGAGLVVAQEAEAADALRDYVLAAAIGVLALTGTLSLALGFTLGRQWLTRIEAVNRTAGAIAAGDLTQRVVASGRGDEFDLLASHLNDMLGRIEAAAAGMRAVSDNVAHDLRRPLARLKTRIEVLLEAPRTNDEYRTALSQTLADADELMRTFEALLTIARLEAGGEIVAPRRFDLAEVARPVAELYAAEAEDSGRPFTVELVAGLAVMGEPRLMGQALANLLDNAMKYAGPDTPIHVRLSREGGQARLAVIDRGPGLSDADKERLVQRFARGKAARSRPGSGLGLALAAAVAQAHRGALQLRDVPGGGLEAAIVLPLARPGMRFRPASGPPAPG